jgi:ABC-type Mn2+/Zn2+ transport system permease subunit/Mn-dependent DtxR family transcriptional regulator
MYQAFLEFHAANPHLIKVLLAGTLVSVVCGVIGCFIVLRRMAFLGDALSHAMLAGVVAGYLVVKRLTGDEARAPAMLLGSVIAALLTVLMIGFVSKVSRIKEDAAIGIMYTGVFAFGGILASLFSHEIHIDLVHFITGNVLVVQDGDLWMMAWVAVIVLTVVLCFFRQLQLTSFDPVMAASIGIPVVLVDYVLTTCTALVVVSGVSIVGVILVVGMLVIPASTAYLLCDRLSRMLVVSAIFGASAFLIGYWFSESINVAPGSAIVVAGCLQFLTVLMVAPRYGLIADWLRRQRMVPQQLVEDVLGALLREPQQRASIATLAKHIPTGGHKHKLKRALASLDRQGLLNVANDTVELTPTGEKEGRRLMRAHRLWEAYLEHVGAPASELHARAHHLEHVNDEAAVDYIDDKLGHPLRDPHGAEIPQDVVHFVPGAIIGAAQLREGHEATVAVVGHAASAKGILAGLRIVAGPRLAQGHVWTFVLPSGQQVELDHVTTDAITVRLDDQPASPPR